MAKIYSYMRISTKEEREKQKYTRQEYALNKYADEKGIEYFRVFKDDASGKDFEHRPEWQTLYKNVDPTDTIVFKDISRFTRQCDEGLKVYLELMEKGVNLVFLDNPSLCTDYIKHLMNVAETQESKIAEFTLRNNVYLLLLIELDRVEQERKLISERTKAGLAASTKKSGRQVGKCDKVSKELYRAIERYSTDRSVKGIELIKQYGISRPTLNKYLKLYQEGKLKDSLSE